MAKINAAMNSPTRLRILLMLREHAILTQVGILNDLNDTREKKGKPKFSQGNFNRDIHVLEDAGLVEQVDIRKLYPGITSDHRYTYWSIVECRRKIIESVLASTQMIVEVSD
jgi:DNA-binding transcriptional ArsR family regulator